MTQTGHGRRSQCRAALPLTGVMSNLTELLQRAAQGDLEARDALFATAYADLRRLAHARLQGGGRNTVLDTTALVHESYLRFLKAGQLRATERRSFFAYAAQVMRSVIIDTVRERQAERRGGNLQHLTLDSAIADALPAGEAELLQVHEALEQLAQVEPRLAQVVEMRYFGGFSEQEIAETLQVTDRTVRRDWDKARLLLKAMLQD